MADEETAEEQNQQNPGQEQANAQPDTDEAQGPSVADAPAEDGPRAESIASEEEVKVPDAEKEPAGSRPPSGTAKSPRPPSEPKSGSCSRPGSSARKSRPGSATQQGSKPGSAGSQTQVESGSRPGSKSDKPDEAQELKDDESPDNGDKTEDAADDAKADVEKEEAAEEKPEDAKEEEAEKGEEIKDAGETAEAKTEGQDEAEGEREAPKPDAGREEEGPTEEATGEETEPEKQTGDQDDNTTNKSEDGVVAEEKVPAQEEQSEEATAAEPTTEEKPAEGDAEPEAVAVGADTAEKSEAQPTGHTAVEDSVPTEEDVELVIGDGAVDGTDPNIRGDEDEVMSEEIRDDSPSLPADFFYDLEDLVSRPVVTEDSGLPNDMLTLHHIFGYDCQKRSNLLMMDTSTCVFAAGNVIEILDLRTREQTYLRTISGGGIGALAMHKNHKYFAVAEKGTSPHIVIYEFPSLKLFRILRGGTETQYSFISFSPDGKLLASVGGDPDYMLTIWNWRDEKTMLRSKAFSQDVFRVTFSADLIGHLTSSGTGHIRFWKMARTFTGLKLQGQLGKFGKTEISDIEGYVELPDGKVLSGTEWGNLLVWDGGLIKVEISRKGGRPCHNGSIQQIIMDEGELMTIGTDGHIRVWDFETVDTADVTDEASIFEMDPMNELQVGNNVSLRTLIKSCGSDEPTIWYAQDANGGIWKLDLSFSFTSQAPERLVSFHAGAIHGCDTSPVTNLVATTGVDRTVRVYDYLAKKQLCEAKFTTGGSSLIWAPEIVDPKGSTLLVGFDDGVVRALTFQEKDEVDVHGRKVKDMTELVLKQAFKPHSGRVTALGMDHTAEVLATGGEDSTLFFLTVHADHFEPIGFVRTPSPVSSLQWAPSDFTRNTLLVTCVGGETLEMEAPDTGAVDTSRSFEIPGVRTREHRFKSVKSRIRREEELAQKLAQKAAEEEERKQREEEERQLRIERGLEIVGEAEEEERKEEEAEEEEEEPWEPFVPPEPSPILAGFYSSAEGRFWLSMDGYDAGYLYECEFRDGDEEAADPEEKPQHEPLRAVPVEKSNDIPISVLKFSKDRKLALMGLRNGALRVAPLALGDVGEVGACWTLNMHDNYYGCITHIATSHDDKFLFTVGEDGNFFAFSLMGQDELQQEMALQTRARIPSAKPIDIEKRIDDIEDPKAYSIEDAKQKSEHDRMMQLADRKKATVKKTIVTMRTQFRRLLEKNRDLPEHLQLDRKEFEMEASIKQELHQQKLGKIEQVRREMSWEQEQCRLQLEKIRSRFKEMIECEHIVVRAFQSQHQTCSFRASKLPETFYSTKAELERQKLASSLASEQSRPATQGRQLMGEGNGVQEDAEADGAPDGAPHRDRADAVQTTTLKGSVGERINKALAKVEEKKRRRAARRAQWTELLASKPDENYEDPADVAAIRAARDNMGDYKLKSALDYVVPDHLRMNAEKATVRLLVLKDLIHQHKYEFNQQLLALRDKKIGIIEQIRGIITQLSHVQELLGPEHSLPLPELPKMHPDEIPEKRFEYTREVLLRFRAELEAREKLGDQAPDDLTGFPAGDDASSDDAGDTPTPEPVISNQKFEMFSPESGFSPKYVLQSAEEELSPLEKQLRQAEQIRLAYELDQLLKQIDTLLKNFDAELRLLRHDKFKLDIDLKNADLRQVTLFEELLLLKDFEKRENILADKLEAKQQDKLDMHVKVLDVQSRYDNKKKDIERLQEKERALNATFQASLGENNKFQDFLTKVFKKRIKRSKKKATEGEGSDSESSEEESSESDWSESDGESESEMGGYDLDICPSGCDQSLYDGTCSLREKRLDIEESLAEEKKVRDNLNKDLEALQKKARVIEASVTTAERELEAFQLEKQQKLNELDVAVTLRLHQIMHTPEDAIALPADLSECLVFEARGLAALRHRISELEHEKTQQKKQQKDAKKKHVQLLKDRKVFATRIAEMHDTCNTMMRDKFGRVVDLEKLETVTVNRGVEELKEKLRENETQCSRELSSWETRLGSARDRITQLIRENTDRLDQLNMLFSEKRTYHVQLDARQKNLGGEFSGEKKSDAHERRRLVQLVHLQAREIEGLRDEIGLLSRKGGHILPPTAGGGPRGAGGGGGGGGGGPGAGEGSVGFMGGGVGYVGGPSPPPPSLPPVIPGTHQHRTHAQP